MLKLYRLGYCKIMKYGGVDKRRNQLYVLGDFSSLSEIKNPPILVTK